MEYTRSQLEAALVTARKDPIKYAENIKELERLIANGVFKPEVNGSTLSTGSIGDSESGSLIFDELNKDESYNQALRKFYSGKMGTIDTISGAKGFRDALTLSDHQNIDRDSQGNITMSNEELKEKSFELFNSAFLNEVSLARFANEINLMSQEERDNLAILYDVWERTKITGEGSRPLWEQVKDAGNILTAPSTYVGGAFIRAGLAPATRLAFSAAMKKMLKVGAKGLNTAETAVIKEGAKAMSHRMGVLGAGYAGGFDVGHQTGVEMQIDPEQDFSYGRAAAMTGAGYVAGRFLPKALRGLGKVVRAPATLVNKPAWGIGSTVTHPLASTGSGFVKTFGGGPAARVHVATEGKEYLGSQADEIWNKMDVDAHGDHLRNKVVEASTKAFSNFKEAFRSLGDLDIRFPATGVDKPGLVPKYPDPFANKTFTKTLDESENSIYRLIDHITGKEAGVPGWGGLNEIRFLLKRGDITPTEALRKIRSKVGSMVKNDKYKDGQFKDTFKRLWFEARDVMSDAARRTPVRDASGNITGNKKQAFDVIDSAYGDFIEVNNHKHIQTLMSKDGSDALNLIKQIGSQAKNNFGKLREHEKRIGEMARFSGTRVNDVIDDTGRVIKPGEVMPNQDLILAAEDAMRSATGHQMFQNPTGSGLKSYLNTKQGRKALKRMFPEQEHNIDRFSKILKNAADKTSMGMYAMRVLTGAFIGFGSAGTGIAGGSLAGLSIVIIDKLLKSPWYGKQAAKVFSRDKTKSALESFRLVKMLQKRGYTSEQANMVLETMLGATVWSYFLADEDRRRSVFGAPSKVADSFVGDIILRNRLSKRALAGIQDFGRIAKEDVFQPVFDTVTDQLISEQ